MAHHDQQNLSEIIYLELDDKLRHPQVAYLSPSHQSLVLNKNQNPQTLMMMGPFHPLKE